PGGAEVGRLEQVRPQVVIAVPVDGKVRGRVVESRALDAADSALRRHAGDVLADVGPVLAAVAADVDEPVVAASPEDPGLPRRLRDGAEGVPEAGAGPAAGQVGADLLPLVAAVGRLEEVVAAEVNGLRVVRREEERRAPVEA